MSCWAGLSVQVHVPVLPWICPGVPRLGTGLVQNPTTRYICSWPPAVNGLKAAKAAGCFAVAVCTSLPGHMLAAQADAVVERLADLDLAAVQPAAAQPAVGA